VVTSRTEAVARDLGEAVAVLPDLDALLGDPAIGLVVIATPNERHADQARQALAAGRHVVVDKPVALDSGEADALIRQAGRAGLMLSVFHNRRWDNDFLTLRAGLAEGLVGRPALFESRMDRFRPAIRPGWRETERPGAGVLFDLGPHLIDQALVLFGPPRTVWADIAAQRPEAVADDYSHLVLGYGELRVILHAGSLVAAPGPRFALHGDRGSFVKHGLDPQEAALRRGLRPGAPGPDGRGWGTDPPEAFGTLTATAGPLHLSARVETLPGDYPAFYRGMAAAIAGRAPVPVAPEDAALGLRVIEAARQSAAEGRVVPFAADTVSC
jgi:scyllo-inositol 2-dehydrogenase (NADP+)